MAKKEAGHNKAIIILLAVIAISFLLLVKHTGFFIIEEPSGACPVYCKELKKSFEEDGSLFKFKLYSAAFEANNPDCQELKDFLLAGQDKNKGQITSTSPLLITESEFSFNTSEKFKVKIDPDKDGVAQVEITGKKIITNFLSGAFPQSLAQLIDFKKRKFKTKGERSEFTVEGVTCEGNVKAHAYVSGEINGVPAVTSFKIKAVVSQECAQQLIDTLGGKDKTVETGGTFTISEEVTRIDGAKFAAKLKDNKVKFKVKGKVNNSDFNDTDELDEDDNDVDEDFDDFDENEDEEGEDEDVFGQILTPLGAFADQFDFKVKKHRALCFVSVEEVVAVCGNSVIEAGEDCDPPDGVTCNENCQFISEPVCGNSVVESGEECDPPDGTTCDENCQLISEAVCGNGILEAGELCEPPNTETCNENCQLIGPSECGNSVIEFPEECDDGNTADNDACSSVCLIEYCGDSICQNVENAINCPQDCEAVCGNSVCEAPAENAETCAPDCESVPQCTNSVCDSGENQLNCPSDCPTPVCSNEVCEIGENAINCPSDCSAVCGNFVCENPPENSGNCPSDCASTCSNSFCDSNENAVTCPSDCEPVCSNGVCEPPTENVTSCSSDCLPSCGNGACDGGLGENSDTCPTDCPILQCGNGIQEDGEQCDGSDLLGNTCTTIGQGFTGGTLACTEVCTFDTSGCTTTVTPPPGPAPTGGGGGGGGGGRPPPPITPPITTGLPSGDRPSCFDGIQNQDEDDVDCGGVCPACPTPGFICGNGLKDPTEECDDGNLIGGDGCDQQCRLEIPAIGLLGPTALFFGGPGALLGWLVLLIAALAIFFQTKKGKAILGQILKAFKR